MERSVIVNVLHRIVHNERVPPAPSCGQVNRKQKSQTERSTLTTAEHESRIEFVVSYCESHESPHVATDFVSNSCPLDVRPETLVELHQERL